MKLLMDVNAHEQDKRIQLILNLEHQYYIDNRIQDFLSVTTLIKEFFPKFDSDIVIQKMRASANWKNSDYYGMTTEQIKKQWEQKKQVTSSLGVLLHNTIENHYNNVNFNTPREVQAEFKQFLAFDSNINWKPYRTEWSIFDERYHICGTIDMVYKDDKTGRFHIVDWKRTASIQMNNPYQSGFYPAHDLDDCKFSYYSLQLNMYKFILERKYNYKVDTMSLVCLHPNNEKFALLEVPNLQKTVESILEYSLKNKIFNKK